MIYLLCSEGFIALTNKPQESHVWLCWGSSMFIDDRRKVSRSLAPEEPHARGKDEGEDEEDRGLIVSRRDTVPITSWVIQVFF